MQVRNAIFAPFMYKNEIILPRRARDKHKENSKIMAFPIGTYMDGVVNGEAQDGWLPCTWLRTCP
eukprot:COSAG06_NODE_1710_length_8634_cov_767.811365_5_plen_65_part_00